MHDRHPRRPQSGNLEAWLDRRVSDRMLDALLDPASFGFLVELRSDDPDRYDIVLTFDQKKGVSGAGLYLGLTKVLTVDESRGRFRMDAAAVYREEGGLPDVWRSWRHLSEIQADQSEIRRYIERATQLVARRYTGREGAVQVDVCSGRHEDFEVITREAIPQFRDRVTRARWMDEISGPIWAAVAASGRRDAWWPSIRNGGQRRQLGAKVDVLAVDAEGNLLALEVKPSDESGGLVVAPLQVMAYAELMNRVLASDVEAAGRLQGMLDQRRLLGLAPDRGFKVRSDPDVVPVLAVGGRPMSETVRARIREVADALPSPSTGVTAMQLREMDLEIDNGDTSAAEFVRTQRSRATDWKGQTLTLTDEGRADGSYRGKSRDFCLTETARSSNLLPEARDVALQRFTAARIPWHDGSGGLPSNHLLSSQVQCVNALAPFVAEPDRLAEMFGDVLDIEAVLPFHGSGPAATEYDRDDHVVFEWVGATDYLGERAGQALSRGAHMTSADAAIRFRTTSGSTAIALIEWKFTEAYRGKRLRGGVKSEATRVARYARWWNGTGPFLTGGRPLESILVEPVYQLFRLHALASEMARAGEGDCEETFVVYAAPGGNTSLLDAFPENGQTWSDAPGALMKRWREHLREPTSLRFFDTETLLAPGSVVSEEYRARYGGNPLPIQGRNG